MNWQRLATSVEVTSRPIRVEVEGRAYAVVRLAPDAPASVYADQCPHRHLPLSVGSVVGGRLRCGYHGWEFDPDGRCALVPSAGDGGPPRAALTGIDGAVERDGSVWIPAGDAARPVPAEPYGSLLGNTDRALRRGWHPAALADELGPGEICVRLLGSDWRLRRVGVEVLADPPPFAVVEDRGIIWLAPEEPVTPRLAVSQDGDPRYPGGWLTPARTTSPAGLMADNFLDVAHFPFVHASTFGAAQATDVPPYDVEVEPGGFRSVQEQWFANPADPGVAAGLRPLRQRRRATYVYRLPLQLLLHLEELDAGSAKVIFFLLQPEDVGSTRVYTQLLVHGIGGVDVPPPDVVASELDFEQAVLDEDLALQAHMRLPGIPLLMRDEVHVRADRSGVALRRALAGLTSTVPP